MTPTAATPWPKPPVWARYALALLAVALATLAGVLVDAASGAPNASLVFVLPVVLAAARFGWGPALVAALAGVVAFNFFLIEPRHTLRVAEASNVWALALLLAVAAVVSAVAAESRRRAVAARAAADQALALQSLARTLVGASSRQAIADCCAEAAARLFSAPSVVLLEERGRFAARAVAGGARLSEADEAAARWALGARHATRGGAYPTPEAEFDFWPVVTAARQSAVIGLRLQDPDAGRPEAPDRLVQIVEGYLAVALDREAYARRALRREVRTAGERLKADLLAAVSHDLKTPLSTIVVTLQSLRRFEREHDAETRSELLAAAEAEAARLGRMVENLLDMGRMEAGAVGVQTAATDPSVLATAALARVAGALAGHRVANEIRRGGAPFAADPALFETALVNLLENAGKYAPAGSTVTLRVGRADDQGWIEVLDEGPGFDRPPETLFEKFVRGREGDGRPPGTGLGLSIAESFAKAQGGALEAGNREDGPGAWVRLRVPLARTVPA
ncbi:DUF4118 domain-containing protein [Phenylobacterium sp.]|uniref:sensor histidine kinase n=1 Tax=Phenylobacterium sp. TaxID=1871053 RepID=UPI0035B34FA3